MKSDGMRHLYVTPTRDKLNEAGFFLCKMSGAADDRDAFRFNLSAFLSAARSVTWVMQKQYAHSQSFSEWLTKKQAEMSANGLMQYFVEQRNQVTKQRAITSSFPVNIYFDQEENKALSIYFIDGTGKTAQPLNIDRVPMNAPGCLYYFKDFPEKDAVSLCQDYLNEVERIVSDWESRFPNE